MRRFVPILFAVLTALASCGKQERELPGDTGPCSLEITVGLPGVGSTKAGLADGDVSEASVNTWSQWDKLVDGQEFYRLTIFLVRKMDERLVAYRDFKWDGSALTDWTDDTYGDLHVRNGLCSRDGTLLPAGTRYAPAARATFNYSHPLHKVSDEESVEKLVTGEYRMLLVANYSATGDVEGKSYDGLRDNGDDFTTLVDDVITAFNADLANGVANFNATNYPKLFKYDVRTLRLDGGTESYTAGDEQYLCSKNRPQPLSLMQDFNALSGDNSIGCELVRTYARIRVEMTNESTISDLTLHSFSFENMFSQKQEYLFDFGDEAGFAAFTADAGVPVVTSTCAIHPYPGSDIVIPKVTESGVKTSQVVFDGYVLESRRGTAHYKYKIDVEYKGATMETTYLVDGKPIQTVSQLQEAYSAGNTKFLLWCLRGVNNKERGLLYDVSGSYVTSEPWATRGLGGKLEIDTSTYELSSQVEGKEVNEIQLDEDYAEYVWVFKKSSSELSSFYVMNLGSGQFWNDKISRSSANADRLTTSITDYAYYTVSNWKNGTTPGIALRNTAATNEYGYLTDENGKVFGWSDSSHNSPSRMWLLYACNGNLAAKATRSVLLQTIDPYTGTPVDVEEILRNDYLRVNIDVSHHPEGGYIYFVVKPWEDKRNQEIVFE